MNESLVSILVPCYNAAPFIAETLDSVLAQTHTDWECIVVDDHSTDNSVEVVKTYCRQYPGKFKLYTNPRKGACAARNVAFENCSGEYVKYLDADDILFDKHVIERQLTYMHSSGYDIVYGIEYYYDHTFEEKNLIKIRTPEMYTDTFATLYFQLHPITSNYLIKKSKINSSVKWNEELKVGQEMYYFLYCYLEGLTFGFVNVNTVKIRYHSSPDRISNSKPKDNAWRKLTMIEKLDELISQYGDKTGKTFLINYEFWKLKVSYEAFIQRNMKCFFKINSLIKKEYDLSSFPKVNQQLWKLNRISPTIGFVWFYFNLKCRKLNLLNSL